MYINAQSAVQQGAGSGLGELLPHAGGLRFGPHSGLFFFFFSFCLFVCHHFLTCRLHLYKT